MPCHRNRACTPSRTCKLPEKRNRGLDARHVALKGPVQIVSPCVQECLGVRCCVIAWDDAQIRQAYAPVKWQAVLVLWHLEVRRHDAIPVWQCEAACHEAPHRVRGI